MGIILVTGSRMWRDEQTIYDVLSSEIDIETDAIIHGGAVGADSIAQKWADANNVKTTIFRPVDARKPEYFLHRNAEMVGICDRVIAFKTRAFGGTDFTIRYALARGKQVRLVEE